MNEQIADPMPILEKRMKAMFFKIANIVLCPRSVSLLEIAAVLFTSKCT